MAGTSSTSTQVKEQSLFFTILVPMLMLVMAEVVLFLAVLGVSGIYNRLNQNDYAIINKQVETRKEYLQSYFLSLNGELEELNKEVRAQAEVLIESGELKSDAIGHGDKGTEALLASVVEPMISSLRTTSSSGVFVILNDHDLTARHDSGAYGIMQGVHLIDQDPGGAPSPRNEDLMIDCGPTMVVQANAITTTKSWTPQFNFTELSRIEDYDFMYLPFQTAYDLKGPKDALDYAYWGTTSFLSTGNDELRITHSIPLTLADGSVIGVVGFDLTESYVNTLLPRSELFNEEDGTYMVARMDNNQLSQPVGQTMQMFPVLSNGYYEIENTQYGNVFSMRRMFDDSYDGSTINGQYYVTLEPMRLYNTNAPFEHQRWVLLGLISHETLHRFTNQAVFMIGVATLLVLLLGAAGSLLLSRGIARPIQKLSAEVDAAEIEDFDSLELSRTGITEVDQLTSAISLLSADVAAVRRLEQERIEYERDYDLLTGLMNRRAFYRQANAIFSKPEQLKHAAIVMLDLDNLKTLNDTYGHDCGDKYIYQAARCFESVVSDKVLLARVSGDEFFMLFYGYDNREDIERDIEKLRVTIPQTKFALPDGTTTYVNASGGVALYLEDSKEFNELMRLADFTMYQVKESGKNNIAYFDFDTYQRNTSTMRAAAELDEVLNNFQLAAYHFQPIVDACTGNIFAYEALMRVSMEHLKGPLMVLELAQRGRRLTEVERMTWLRSLECFRTLREGGQISKDAYLFVNSFANLSLEEEELHSIARQYQEIMGNVVIEITEVVDMDERATAIKRDIPGSSGLFALDDYGSGYNSEVKLLTLRPKFVKIDISIIRHIDFSVDKQRMVAHAVEYAHERDMLIIAEGVETADEMRMLLDLGVDLLQGFFLAPPDAVPGSISVESIKVIKEHNPSGESTLPERLAGQRFNSRAPE